MLALTFCSALEMVAEAAMGNATIKCVWLDNDSLSAEGYVTPVMSATLAGIT